MSARLGWYRRLPAGEGLEKILRGAGGHPAKIDGQASRAPAAGLGFEHSRQRRATGQAFAGRIQMPLAQGIPVAADQPLAATGAIGALAAQIVDVADIDVAQA